MFKFSFVLLSLIAATASGAPILEKRIAQTIAASTAKWEQACLAAGGGLKCNPQSIASFTTLLAAAGPCEQQDQADNMIDLAKTLQNNAQVIALTQIFAQQPRNTPTSQSVPYCQKAPRNAELNGLFQCQFAGANPKVFVGGVAVGGAGTIPFGHNTPLNPAGSCLAHPAGPVPDGQQLVDITQNPGNVNTGSKGSKVAPTSSTSSASSAPPAATSAPANNATAPPAANPAASSGDFHLQNGLDAQKLNAEFSTLTANSACTDGENACVGTSFAQCVGGKFVTTACAGGLECLALPLVNKPGTSVTCTTQADALARIAATGATGGLTGNGSTGSSAKPSTNIAANSPKGSSNTPKTSTTSSGDFHLLNGEDAQKLNAGFATLTADSPCTSGENACVGSQFAQCVNGKFVTTACAGDLTCTALPLVNKRGTSITCTTQADALARIAATGAKGGLTGA